MSHAEALDELLRGAGTQFDPDVVDALIEVLALRPRPLERWPRASVPPVGDLHIAPVAEADLPDLLPLLRGYCDFYEVAPSDVDLLAMSRALMADPEREGVQLLARDGSGGAIGFATVLWTWSTLSASRIGVMNDLFVVESAAARARPTR